MAGIERAGALGAELALGSIARQQVSSGAELVNSFGGILEQALDAVNDMQTRADRLTQRLAAGELSDVHQVMIAVEQVSIAMQLTVQVRNKIIESYQEIMRMQV